MSQFLRNGDFNQGILKTPTCGVSYNTSQSDWASMKEDRQKNGTDNPYLVSNSSPPFILSNQTQYSGAIPSVRFPKTRGNSNFQSHQQNLTGKESGRSFKHFRPSRRGRPQIKMERHNSLSGCGSNDKEHSFSRSPPDKGTQAPTKAIENTENRCSVPESPAPSLSNSQASGSKTRVREKTRFIQKERKLDVRKNFSPIMNLDEILTKGKSTPFQVVVLFADSYNPMKDSDLDYVEQKLLSYVRKEIYRGGQVLRYEKKEHTKNGWLLITCADENTVRWTVKRVIPEFNGNKFRIIRTRDLPKYFTIEIVFPATGIDCESMLEMLEQQNSGLKTRSWFILNKKKPKNSDDTTIIEAKIPASQLPILHKLQWKPYFEFSRATIRKCVLEPERKKFVKNKPLETESKFNGDFSATKQNNTEGKTSTGRQRDFDYNKVHGKNKSLEGSVIAEVSLIDSDETGDEPVKSPNSKSEIHEVSSDAEIEIVSPKSINDIFSVSEEENEREENEDPAESMEMLYSQASSESEFIMSDSDENESSELFNALRHCISKEGGSGTSRERLNKIVLSDSDSECEISVNRNMKRKSNNSVPSKSRAHFSHSYSGKRLRSAEHPGKKEKDSNSMRNKSGDISSDIEIVEDTPVKNDVIFISDDENQKENVNGSMEPAGSAATVKKVRKRGSSIGSGEEPSNVVKTTERAEASSRKNTNPPLSPVVIDLEDESSDQFLMLEGETFIVVSETEEESNNCFAEGKTIPENKEVSVNEEVVQAMGKSPLSEVATDAVPHEGCSNLCSEGEVPEESSVLELDENLFVVEGEAFIIVSETAEEQSSGMPPRLESENEEVVGTEDDISSIDENSQPETPEEGASALLPRVKSESGNIAETDKPEAIHSIKEANQPETPQKREKIARRIPQRVKSEYAAETEGQEDVCSTDEASQSETLEEATSTMPPTVKSERERFAGSKDLDGCTTDEASQSDTPEGTASTMPEMLKSECEGVAGIGEPDDACSTDEASQSDDPEEPASSDLSTREDCRDLSPYRDASSLADRRLKTLLALKMETSLENDKEVQGTQQTKGIPLSVKTECLRVAGTEEQDDTRSADEASQPETREESASRMSPRMKSECEGVAITEEADDSRSTEEASESEVLEETVPQRVKSEYESATGTDEPDDEASQPETPEETACTMPSIVKSEYTGC